MEKIIKAIDAMKSSGVSNYVIAGLDSYLLGNGCVRYFENSRWHQDSVTPHSHRFDFACLVLKGHVINRIWVECIEELGDFFQESVLQYSGTIGEHTQKAIGRSYWEFSDMRYVAGECYNMTAIEIHSIQFSKGAKVLFFEQPESSKKSLILEPVVRGEVIHTYRKDDYMFKEI